MKSIAEIGVLEKAHMLGASSIGLAAEALSARWQSGMRDNETFIRLSFLSWYSCVTPGIRDELVESLPNIDALLIELGGIPNVSSESKFTLAALANLFPYCLGDESRWTDLATQLPLQAQNEEPKSLVFSEWRYIFGLTKERNALRKDIAAEFHARFDDRGYMGTYLEEVFGRILSNKIQQGN